MSFLFSLGLIVRFASWSLSHHSADVAGEGDPFAGFVLGAAAAAA